MKATCFHLSDPMTPSRQHIVTSVSVQKILYNPVLAEQLATVVFLGYFVLFTACFSEWNRQFAQIFGRNTATALLQQKPQPSYRSLSIPFCSVRL